MKKHKRKIFILCVIAAVMLFVMACNAYTARADNGSTEMTSPSVAVNERTITVFIPYDYESYALEFALFLADYNGLTTVVNWQTNNVFEDIEYGAYLAGMRFADDTDRYTTVSVIVRQSAIAPAYPIISRITATSITVVVPEGYEYLLEWRLLSPIGAVERSWQSNPVFSGLTPNTDYRVQARLIQTLTHNASPPSEREDLMVRTVDGRGDVFESGSPESGCGNCGMFSAVGLLTIMGIGLLMIIFVKRR